MARCREPSSAPLVVGLAISVAVHLGVLVPILFAVMTARSEAAPDIESDFDADAVEPPTEEREIELGKDESTRSTLVWLGYDKYEEQLAARSQVDQAAFDERPFGAMPTNPAPPAPEAPQQPAEEAEPDDPVEMAEAETPAQREPEPLQTPGEFERELERETDSVQPTLEAPVDAPDAQPTPMPADEPVAPEQPPGVDSAPRPIGEGPSLEMLSQFLQHMLSTAQQAAQEKAMSRAAGETDEHAAPDDAQAAASQSQPARETEAESEEPRPSQPTPPVTASEPAPPTDQPGEQREADQADQESDATTAEITMDELKVGKPLIAHGLELKPRKPTFTQLIRMTALPGNPLCELRFQANGRPALARLLSSSGDSRVDDAVLASLYRWRAAGEPLEELGEGETITVRIQILFNAR